MFQRNLFSKSILAATMAGAVALTGCSKSAEKAEAPAAESKVADSGDTIKVGILHSLSGTMAISETSPTAHREAETAKAHRG